MEIPVCNITYSNACDVSDVTFLNDVEQFAKKLKQASHVVLCNYCFLPGTPSQPLQRCGGCQLVSYCSRDCQKYDRSMHKYVCKEFPVVNGKNAFFTTGPMKEHLDHLRERAAQLPLAEFTANHIFLNPRFCNTCKETRQDRLTDCVCTCVSYCKSRCADADTLHKVLCAAYRELELGSYPMSLRIALESLPGHRLGRDGRSLEDLTSLTIHVVTSSPLFDSKTWEEDYMHLFPKLKQLDIVFIVQGKALKPSFLINEKLSLHRCEDCETNNRVITYSVQQMQYHMYFSSIEYTEPDVVVVYDNTYEMTASQEDDINKELSYRNMTYSPDTVLVMMDATQELVRKGANDVNAARSVDQLVSPMLNGAIVTLSKGATSDNRAMSDKYYFTCLTRNQ